jgi:nitronate monooxygenase
MAQLRTAMPTNEATRRLGIEHPVVQGPFGGGLSSARLAATVSNLGGLGSYGAYTLAPDAIGTVVNEIRGLTRHPFAMNLWVSGYDAGGDVLDHAAFERGWRIFEPYYRELGVAKPAPPRVVHQPFAAQLEALLAARPPVFSFVFGVPPATALGECRRLGIVTIGAATSLDEAEALEAAGVDLIVATGAEAGGHRPTFIGRAEDALCGTFSLAQVVARRVKAPVIAAGGIVDGRGIRAVLELGAQAAQIGTAFLACEESGTTDLHRQALFSARARETTLTRVFTGRLARGLRNRWSEELSPRAAELPPFPVTGWFAAQLRPAALAAGRTDLVTLWSGQAAPNLRHRNATALMHSLLSDLYA